MASRPATGWARLRPPFPMRACWPTSWAAPVCCCIGKPLLRCLSTAIPSRRWLRSAAAEHGIPLIHVGAGQCPKDMSSPEGRHAELTDRLSSLLCCLDPADEQGLHARQMERGPASQAIPSMICPSRTDPACSPLRRQSVMEQPSGNSSRLFFPAGGPPQPRRHPLPAGRIAGPARPAGERPVLLVQHPSALCLFPGAVNRSRTVSASCRP